MSSSYLYHSLDINNLSKIVTDAKKYLRKKMFRKHYAIAFRGMSGAMIAPILCRDLKKSPILIRKESSHSSYTVEHWLQKSTEYIIIDDFVNTGETIKTIIREIKEENKLGINKLALSGIYLYSPSPGWDKHVFKKFCREHNCWIKTSKGEFNVNNRKGLQ
jgi:hypoxanthine phosphoribosyltransferase